MTSANSGKQFRTYSRETYDLLLLKAREQRQYALIRMKERQKRRIIALGIMRCHGHPHFAPISKLSPELDAQLSI